MSKPRYDRPISAPHGQNTHYLFHPSGAHVVNNSFGRPSNGLNAAAKLWIEKIERMTLAEMIAFEDNAPVSCLVFKAKLRGRGNYVYDYFVRRKQALAEIS